MSEHFHSQPDPRSISPSGSEAVPVDLQPSMAIAGRYRVLTALSQHPSARTFFVADEHKPTQTFCAVAARPADAPLSRETLVRWEQLSQHPHIPSLLASFDRDGRQYLVQEYVMGQSAHQQVLESGPWNETQIQQLLDDVLPVLGDLHDKKLVHRDIKPQNLIRRQSDNRWILVDFGSLHSHAVPSSQDSLTGSAEYAAPEQLQGRPLPQSDLYSLGVTCLYLLTDLSPFELYDDRNDIWNWRSRCRYPLSDRLAAILDRMVARELPKRYPNAKAVLKDLHRRDRTPLLTSLLLARPALLALLAVSFGSSLLQLWWSDRPQPVANQSEVAPRIHHKPVKPQLETALPLKTLARDTSPVWSVAVSPDGRSIVTGTSTGSIDLRNLDRNCLDGNCAAQLSFAGHSAPIWSVAVSPDNRTVATAGEDRTVRLWNRQTGELIATWNGHDAEIYDIAFSPDGRVLATASADGKVKIWDATPSPRDRTSTPLHTLSGHRDEVKSLAFSPNGRVLVTASEDGTVKLWDWQTGQYLKTLAYLNVPVWSVAVSPDGQTVATGSADGYVQIWDLGNGRRLRVLTNHDNLVQSLAFSPQPMGNSRRGKYLLATADVDGTIFLWDTDTGAIVGQLEQHAGWVDLAFSPDGRRLVSGGFDSTVKVLDLQMFNR
ncbi:protein kinase domain-containing protein [Baaleninema sp.]|uniref:protein kinase domain-containing protein n=1 Tax=Baaleninema sp. TaxID=3101197 RepID=UPI003D029B3B